MLIFIDHAVFVYIYAKQFIYTITLTSFHNNLAFFFFFFFFQKFPLINKVYACGPHLNAFKKGLQVFTSDETCQSNDIQQNVICHD